MMIHEDQIALNTLAFLAKTASQLDAFRAQLKQTHHLHAASFVECRYYGDILYICLCLEAALPEDQTLTWWLDITPRDHQWLIESSALWNGRDPVAQFPARVVPGFRDVEEVVPEILEQLLQAGLAVLTKVMNRAAAAHQPATHKLT
jgi:hypothetical protein